MFKNPTAEAMFIVLVIAVVLGAVMAAFGHAAATERTRWWTRPATIAGSVVATCGVALGVGAVAAKPALLSVPALLVLMLASCWLTILLRSAKRCVVAVRVAASATGVQLALLASVATGWPSAPWSLVLGAAAGVVAAIVVARPRVADLDRASGSRTCHRPRGSSAPGADRPRRAALAAAPERVASKRGATNQLAGRIQPMQNCKYPEAAPTPQQTWALFVRTGVDAREISVRKLNRGAASALIDRPDEDNEAIREELLDMGGVSKRPRVAAVRNEKASTAKPARESARRSAKPRTRGGGAAARNAAPTAGTDAIDGAAALEVKLVHCDEHGAVLDVPDMLAALIPANSTFTLRYAGDGFMLRLKRD